MNTSSLTPAAPPPTLHTALREVLRLYAPGATLLTALEGEVLRVGADGIARETGGELVPPDAWLEGGELTWLTRGGTLLGLMWCEGAAPPADVADLLTLLLGAARGDGDGREADVLVTQFPLPAAWLRADLTFRQVSRPFLELLGLSDAQVLGRPLRELLPGMPALAAGLVQAAAGRTVSLPDEPLPPAPGGAAARGTVWVRGEARPSFGGAGAGVLWTLRDVTAEHRQAELLEALLGGHATPAALLTPGGTVLHASPGWHDLLPGAAFPGSPLWACFPETPPETLQALVREAAQGGPARARVPLAAGGSVTLSVRQVAARENADPLLVVEAGTEAGPGTPGDGWGGAAARVLALGDHAALLVDHAGRTQLVSERAAELLGLEASRLLGVPLTRALGDLGVRLHTPEGAALSLPDLRAGSLTLPLETELLLVRPDGGGRHLEVRGTLLPGEHPGAPPGLLLTLRDVSALRHAQARLRHGARHDPLTGLLNRAGLRETLVQGAPGTALCLDLDGFGALNAALGRTACDHLLIGVAARLGDLADARGGRAARLGDDAFALFLPHSGPPETADLLAGAVRAALAAPVRAGRQAVPLTFALGVAPVSLGTDGAALANAEIALAHARSRGRAGTSTFTPGMREEVAATFRLEEALREALAGEEKGLTLHYQPTLHLASGRVTAAEALLRWAHPALGELPPSQVLPLAARAGLMAPLAEWVLGRAALQGQAWRETHPGLRLSVNLSLRGRWCPGPLEGLWPLLAGHPAPDVEVSAACLLDPGEGTLDLLDTLREHGARLWVDDFGEGTTSLSTLGRFPLTGIKLHPNLTARLPGDPRGVTLVEATLDLARRLGWQVTAVGVETAAALELLRDLGCDAVQGHAVCPPLDPEDLGAWLRER
ncbi:GGDEF domain-containing protein [Deinococcus aetherius]|uniref:GGDEF domain-containing protein n=1 Tax=Deinococcus aetherius TaxID=200252 RepID=A0ABN6RHI7_9DEIO|nr:EAL domain-containing protein [Deinococcus aetherius]BDP42827.1 GGDEF domain-containing protein [Deinococcus aetherius]